VLSSFKTSLVVAAVILSVRVSVSPDSGISSLPSPVSLPDNCLAAPDAMVLRSHRLVQSSSAHGRYDSSVKFVTDVSPELCLEVEK